MARLAGAVPQVLPCSAAEGYLLTAGQLRAALTERSRLLILCTPSNPTGAVYPPARLQVETLDWRLLRPLVQWALRPGSQLR